MNNLMRFKYSFMAVIATMLAIMLNLLFVFSIPALLIISITLFIGLFAARYVLENYNLVAIFYAFFMAGLLSSAIYNNYSRVYEAPNYLHDEKTWVKGEITDIKIKNKYARVYLKNPELYTDLADNVYIPNIIVSTFSSRLKDAKVGDELTAKVLLQKPPGKLFADDFDYAKYLLQNKINLTAQVRGDLYITDPVDGYSLLQKMANYRLDVANKIKLTYENSQVAGLTMALITGIRGGVEKQVQEDFKKSGLAHLMAISGMHMAFLAGIIFLLVRYFVCLIPVVALNYDSKKIAGVFTLFAALFYLLLAGASLPTQRAFIMISLFIVTMLLNRSKVALHTLCVVAILILLADPMAIFSASFQLSFSAVFAMLLYNELKQDELVLDFSQKAKLWRGFKNSLNISILAFSATMFVVSVHFGYLSVFAILANVFASILMAILVMPALFAYFIGFIVLDISIFKYLSEYSLTLLLNLADYFADFANSSVYISPSYAFVLLFVAISIITLIVLDYPRKYLLSLVIFFTSFFAPINFDLRPTIIELKNGSIALRNGDELTLLGQLDKRSINKLKEFYKLKLASNELNKDCDISGCVYDFANKKILHLNEGFDISNEDLTLVDYVVSYN